MAIAYGSYLEVENAAGSGVFVRVAKLTSLAKPNASTDEVDVTHMESPGRAKQFEPGMTDFGEIAYGIIWDASSATDLLIEAFRASGEVRACRAGYGQTGKFDTYQGFPKGYEAAASSPGEPFKGTLTMRVASLPVRT